VSKKIIVIGDAIIDEYEHYTADRISPEAPVMIARPLHNHYQPGGCLNVALNLSRLGNDVVVITQMGNDIHNNYWVGVAKAEGIRTLNIANENYKTIHKKRLIANGQHLLRVDTEAFVEPELSNEDVSEIENHLISANLVIISDYAKGCISSKMMKVVSKTSKRFIVDPKNSDWSRYFGAELITPNRAEIKKSLNVDTLPNRVFLKDIMSKFSVNSILITKSEEGMELFSSCGKNIEYTACAKKVVDVTGAGDVVVSVIGHLLSRDEVLSEAVNLANIIAGISVSTFGTHVTSIGEIKSAQITNRDLVFTNGCFDILHAGHVNYLKKAKSFGTNLIVGLNSDSSVKKIKGENRPINSQNYRKELLEALECVDEVIIFDEDTPFQLIKKLKPDILVKGADWKVEQIAGADFVLNNGGEVRTIQFDHDISTTQLVSKIRNA